ncbi:hypothetical protein [Prevotella histicola]|uniref:hypothetical protein n=1 Tax=Prevotella histicola TaxID=470565 RepID=UPI001C5F0787|nr:hypothetical protein [Prevotella histicola]MBW4775079.1 hypothetical protein [Prevotella histicola]
MKQRNSAILSYGRTIRKSTANDVSLIMDFIRQGRAKMIAAGNVNQWSDKHPSRQTIEKDIAQGASYLLCENDTPIATFALLAGPEPTYSYTRVRDKKRLEKVGNLVKNSYLYR